MSQPQGTATAEELLETWLNEHSEDGLTYEDRNGLYIKEWNEGEMEDGKLTGTFKKVYVPTYNELVELYGI